ncbi:MAG: hypothetical protein HY905_27110 [Deltaproteobacteria bacterium]|nr:hypothetical protein [Deltaproteobacteria bacterium]
MVRGLERFREHFKDHANRYVLIGGVACELALVEAGLTFRATKDLDIVLCLETLDAEFARAFWAFVKEGGYELQESSSGEKKFYRFKKPAASDFPYMLELFSRVPDALGKVPAGRLTPIPVDDEVSSLSAILLDDAYYAWIHAGRRDVRGLPIVRPEHLIPLKAKAWLDLRRRAVSGEDVDSRDIKKHKNDVFRLYAVVDPEYRAPLLPTIEADMRRFLEQVPGEPIELKAFGLASADLVAVLDVLRTVYRCGSR